MTDQTARVVDKNGEGPGVNRVGRVGIAVVTTYLLGFTWAFGGFAVLFNNTLAAPRFFRGGTGR